MAILWPSCGAAELAGDGGHDFGRTARRCKVRGRAEGEVLALEDDRHGLNKRIHDDRAVGIFKACRLLVLQGTAQRWSLRMASASARKTSALWSRS